MVETPLIQQWIERIQAQLPFTVPTGALIATLLAAAFIFYQMLRILLTSATAGSAAGGGRTSTHPNYAGATDSDGRYHGHGTLRLSNGNKYTGHFSHGLFDGHGVYSFRSTGTAYDGQWVGGAKEGRGRETYSDGSVYVGEFKAGEREGRGRMEYGGDRGVFDGGWKGGRKHGEGKVKERVNGKWKWKKGVWADGRVQKSKAEEGAEAGAEDEGEEAEEEEEETAGGEDEQSSIRQRNNAQQSQQRPASK